MPEQPQQEDRTEAATPRRLQKAREEGQVPISREFVLLAGLAAVALVLAMGASSASHDLAKRLTVFFEQTHALDVHDGSAFRLAFIAWITGAAPFVLAALLAGMAAVLLQTRFLLNWHALKPDFARVSPGAGFKRLASADSLVEAAKSLAKVGVLTFVVWQVLRADLPSLLQAMSSDPRQLLGMAAGPVLHVLLVMLAAQAAIAAVDIFWVVLRHARKLRMSRHDIQEEQKETEGDPMVKARQRQIRTVRARRRMLAAVPKAAVVITNPTHYAVALAYDRAKHAAPRLVAKGVDSLALRIREVAEANKVPLVANPPLARALFLVEVDAEIPPEHYQAVAEIIAYVWRLGRPLAKRVIPVEAEVPPP